MPFLGRTPAIILFDHVTKFNTEIEPPGLIFGSVSCCLPTNLNVAILGRRETGRTTLLELLQGQARPDVGDIITNTKFSMILNKKSYFHPAMTVTDNIASLARMYDMNKDRITRLVMSLPGLKPAIWTQTVREMDIRDRKSIEILLAGILPYDCYLVDDIEKLDQNAFRLMVKLASSRAAGVIFTTYNIKFARQYANCFAVIANQNLHLFESVEKAENFYAR